MEDGKVKYRCCPPRRNGDPWWTFPGWSNHVVTNRHQKNAKATERKQRSRRPKSPLRTAGPSISAHVPQSVGPEAEAELEHFDQKPCMYITESKSLGIRSESLQKHTPPISDWHTHLQLLLDPKH